ncbi:hypothetical protein ACFL35_18480, partial [Candidatus Riflebacteria bacterium]
MKTVTDFRKKLLELKEELQCLVSNLDSHFQQGVLKREILTRMIAKSEELDSVARLLSEKCCEIGAGEIPIKLGDTEFNFNQVQKYIDTAQECEKALEENFRRSNKVTEIIDKIERFAEGQTSETADAWKEILKEVNRVKNLPKANTDKAEKEIARLVLGEHPLDWLLSFNSRLPPDQWMAAFKGLEGYFSSTVIQLAVTGKLFQCPVEQITTEVKQEITNTKTELETKTDAEVEIAEKEETSVEETVVEPVTDVKPLHRPSVSKTRWKQLWGKWGIARRQYRKLDEKATDQFLALPESEDDGDNQSDFMSILWDCFLSIRKLENKYFGWLLKNEEMVDADFLANVRREMLDGKKYFTEAVITVYKALEEKECSPDTDKSEKMEGAECHPEISPASSETIPEVLETMRDTTFTHAPATAAEVEMENQPSKVIVPVPHEKPDEPLQAEGLQKQQQKIVEVGDKTSQADAEMVDETGDTLTPPDTLKEKQPRPGLNDGVPLKELVSKVLSHQPEACLITIIDLCWRLFRKQRTGVAVEILNALSKNNSSPYLKVISHCFRIYLLGFHVRGPHGETVKYLGEFASQMHEVLTEFAGDNNGPFMQSISLLTIASTLRPALLSADHSIRALSDYLTTPFSELHSLRKEVQKFSQMGLTLTPATLKGLREHAQWKKEINKVIQQVREKEITGKQKSIIYPPSTHVWRHWLSSEGRIGQLIQIIFDNKSSKIPEAKKIIEQLSNDREFESYLRKTDHEIRDRSADLRPIGGRAVKTLKKQSGEFLQLAEEWIALRESEPASLEGQRHRQADECRARILTACHQIRQSLNKSNGEKCNNWEDIAIYGVGKCLDDLERLFSPESREAEFSLAPEFILKGELLHEPRIHLDENWQLSDEISCNLVEILGQLAACPPTSLETAFSAQCKEKNHLATQWILELLQSKQEYELYNRLFQEREREIFLCVERLKRAINSISACVENALVNSLFSEDVRLSMVAKLESVLPEKTLDFQVADKKVDKIQQDIEKFREQTANELRKRIEDSAIQYEKPEVYQRILAGIEKGDFLVANELIHLIQSGDESGILAGGKDKEQVFDNFFPEFVSNWSEDGNDITLIKLAQKIASGSGYKGFHPPQGVSSTEQKISSEMVKSWNKIRARNPRWEGELESFFQNLGLVNSQLKKDKEKAGQHAWFSLQCLPVVGKQSCPIPELTSIANGHYRVLCLWKRPSASVILEFIHRERSTNPVLVLFLGRMTEWIRREISHLSRQRGLRNILFIDETLLIFLCSLPGSKMHNLFKCTAPFSIVNPYTITAGLVPPEIFYGREKESASVFAHDGTNMVFGGRQLGKTALLRHVVRLRHNSAREVYVFWIDLIVEGIGQQRPIEDIWQVILKTLVSEKILPGASQQFRKETLIRRTEDWLKEYPNRRLVFL